VPNPADVAVNNTGHMTRHSVVDGATRNKHDTYTQMV
jgi:hypothetical protein